jgi:hypothetical protein
MARHTLASLALLTLLGCSSSYFGSIGFVTPMPDGSTLSNTGGQLHTGIAAGFVAGVTRNDFWGEHNKTDDIGVVSSNPSVLGVASAPNGQSVVFAVAPGTATLIVTVGGGPVLKVPVTVTDPPYQLSKKPLTVARPYTTK